MIIYSQIFFVWTPNKCLVCNCYSNANENLSKLHFQCCLFLKIFLRQQEHHIIINDNPQIARDGIIISFIVVKVFTLMKRVQILISAKDKSIQLTVLCFLQKKVHMLASVAEQYMIAKSFEKPMTMHENTIMLNVQLTRTIFFRTVLGFDLQFIFLYFYSSANIACFCKTECKFIVRFMLNYRVKTVLINKKGQV